MTDTVTEKRKRRLLADTAPLQNRDYRACGRPGS